jgi:3-dehydroquinate synthase
VEDFRSGLDDYAFDQSHIHDFLANLHPRERLIVKLRYGIGTRDGQGYTLEHLGALLGISKERVRQIETKTLRKIRESTPVRGRTDDHADVYVFTEFGIRPGNKLFTPLVALGRDALENNRIPEELRARMPKRALAIPATWGLWTRWFGFSPADALRLSPGFESQITLWTFTLIYIQLIKLFPYLEFVWIATLAAAFIAQLIFTLGGMTGVMVRDEVNNQPIVVPVADERAPSVWRTFVSHMFGAGLKFHTPYYLFAGVLPFAFYISAILGFIFVLVVSPLVVVYAKAAHRSHNDGTIAEREFTVEVKPDLSYDVAREANVLDPYKSKLGKYIKENRKVFVVVRDGDQKNEVEQFFRINKLSVGDPTILVIPKGESMKANAEAWVAKIHSAADRAGLSRKDVFLLIGDEDVMSVASFAGARFHRGVPMIRIPTTKKAALLDFPAGHPMVGSAEDGLYFSPEVVLLDPTILKTHVSNAVGRVYINPDYTYRVRMTRGIFHAENPNLARQLQKRKFLVVVDSLVGDAVIAQMRERFKQIMQARGQPEVEPEILIVPGGESIKNERAPEFIKEIHKRARDLGLTHQDAIVAIGGGALIDAVGFAASRFKRGTPLIRIPTTLLAQIDGSIGAKNAINVKLDGSDHLSKNLDGVFATPEIVFVDPTLLISENERHKKIMPPNIYMSGLAEGIKVSLIKDNKYFKLIEDNIYDIRGGHFNNRSRAEDIMWLSIVRHLEQIRTDPFEWHLARPLDYGHQWGHRLEALTNFTLLHGEGVTIGSAIDSVISHLRGYITRSELERILNVIERAGLPIFHELATVENLWPGLESFRRHLGGVLTLSLLQGIGRKKDVNELSKEELGTALDYLRSYTRRGLKLSDIENLKFLAGADREYVYEGTNKQDGARVIVKFANGDIPPMNGVSQAEHEIRFYENLEKTDPELRKEFLPKMLGYGRLTSDELIGRFPHIKNGAYLILEKFDGEVLNDRVKRLQQELPHIARAEAFDDLIAIANALKKISKRNVIHGDLDAQEILLQPGRRVKIVDWGIAHTKKVHLRNYAVKGMTEHEFDYFYIGKPLSLLFTSQDWLESDRVRDIRKFLYVAQDYLDDVGANCVFVDSVINIIKDISDDEGITPDTINWDMVIAGLNADATRFSDILPPAASLDISSIDGATTRDPAVAIRHIQEKQGTALLVDEAKAAQLNVESLAALLKLRQDRIEPLIILAKSDEIRNGVESLLREIDGSAGRFLAKTTPELFEISAQNETVVSADQLIPLLAEIRQTELKQALFNLCVIVPPGAKMKVVNPDFAVIIQSLVEMRQFAFVEFDAVLKAALLAAAAA